MIFAFLSLAHRLKNDGQNCCAVLHPVNLLDVLRDRGAPLDFAYMPYSQTKRLSLTLIAESNVVDAATLAPVLREVVHSIDPGVRGKGDNFYHNMTAD
jgi:hypothetical protein